MSLAAYLGIASGIALVLTGLGLALARPQRSGSLVFAGFLVVWGIKFSLFNSLDLPEDLGLILSLERVALAFSLVDTLFLIHFTVRFSRSFDGSNRWWSWGTATYVVVVGALLALQPTLFSQPAGRTDLASLLIHAPNFAVLYVTLGILVSRYRSPATDIERRETRIVLVALSLYAAYTAGFYLVLYGNITWFDASARSWGRTLLFGLFTIATAYIVWQAVRLWSDQDLGLHRTSPGGQLIPAAILVPLVLGLVTGLGEAVDLIRVDLFGLLRIGTALLIAYGLLKFQLFGIDLTVKTGLKRSTIVGAFVAVFFLVSEGVELVVSGNLGTAAGLAAAGAMTAALRPLERGAQHLADQVMPGVEPSGSYLDRRRLDVYQAAVERAARDRKLDDRERDVLATLADDLGVGRQEARRIEQDVFRSIKPDAVP